MTRNRKQVTVATALVVAAAVLHGYEWSVLDGEAAQLLFFLWSMAPYIVCVLVLILSSTALHVISAAAVALVLDGLTHYSVVTSDNSTASLAFLWTPIWNTLIFVPLAMGVTLIAIRRRRTLKNAL